MAKDDTTYVYNNAEVKMTGRTARRKIEVDSTVVRKGQQPKIVEEVILYEIEPIEGEKWNKWVKMTDLFIIDAPVQKH